MYIVNNQLLDGFACKVDPFCEKIVIYQVMLSWPPNTRLDFPKMMQPDLVIYAPWLTLLLHNGIGEAKI